MRQYLKNALCLLVVFASTEHVATGKLPSGWQELSASELVKIVRTAIQQEGDEFEERQDVSALAWNQFLSDPDFIAKGDWDAAHWLFTLFGDSDVAQEHEAAKRALGEAFAKRIASDSSVLDGKDLYVLGWELKQLEKAGFTDVQKADAFASWMDRNDWKGLDLASLYNLYSWVNADAIDRRRFSVRWSGSITAPRTGDYIFRQARVFAGDDSRVRIWINSSPVLDSSEGGDKSTAFSSDPVSLTGGQPAVVRVELIHETFKVGDSGQSTPMALLTWSGPGFEQQIIPTDALAPPSGEGSEPKSGLLVEYFADTTFSERRAIRVDPTFDLIWSWPPAVPVEQQASDEVFEEILKRVLDEAYLNQVAISSRGDVETTLDYTLWRVAYRMRGSQRLELIDLLRSNPAILAKMSPRAMGRLYRGCYMLPGDSKLDLLGDWSLSVDQPRSRPGWFPGWGEGGYQQLNTDFYWLIGLMMQGPYADDGRTLCDFYLERPNGDCNLHVAYAAAFAGNDRAVRNVLLDRIEMRLDGETLTADQRVTWLIAKAFVMEVPASHGRPRPLRGRDALVDAIGAAQSSTYRAWAVEELVSRLLSVGHFSQARQLIDDHGGLLTATEGSRTPADWRADANRLAALAEQREADGRTEAEQLYQEEIKRRQRSVR